MKETLPNIHPGEVLLEEWFKLMEISQPAQLQQYWEGKHFAWFKRKFTCLFRRR